jgi:hypothetical protein
MADRVRSNIEGSHTLTIQIPSSLQVYYCYSSSSCVFCGLDQRGAYIAIDPGSIIEMSLWGRTGEKRK